MFSLQFSIKDNHRDIIMVKNVTVVIFYEILFRMLFQSGSEEFDESVDVKVIATHWSKHFALR